MTITDLDDSYRIDVHINDKYDFDNYWKIKGMKDILNNLGYFLQSSDILNPYEWDANFTIYEKKE